MRLIILSSEVYQVLAHFSTLSNKRRDFQIKLIKHKMRVLILSTTSV